MDCENMMYNFINTYVYNTEVNEIHGYASFTLKCEDGKYRTVLFRDMFYCQVNEACEQKKITSIYETNLGKLRSDDYAGIFVLLKKECANITDEYLQMLEEKSYRFYIHTIDEHEYLVIAKNILYEQ